MESHQSDIVIIGCGPTGVVLANLLGQLGCKVMVLERQPEIYPIPRATHIDEETLRNFQTTGLMPQLTPHTTPFGYVEIVDEDGSVLLEDKFAASAGEVRDVVAIKVNRNARRVVRCGAIAATTSAKRRAQGR